ncbi:radical SAM protein [Natronospora cellulosivora (SeqCode)]
MYKYKPVDLFYLVSFDCNQRCSKCSHWKMKYEDELLDVNKFIKNILALDTIEELCIVGGEPLVHKEKVSKIIKSIVKKDIRTVIITNGVLMDKEFIDFLANYNVHIVVSIDTMEKNFWEYIRGDQSYDLVINNTRYASRILQPSQLSIQSVLAEETRNHVKNVAAFAEELGIYHSIQAYVQDGFNGKWTSLESDKHIQVPEKTKTQCYAAGKNLSVMPNGDVFTCFQQQLISECRRPIGNLKKDKLNELLKSEYILKILEKMQKCNLPCKVLKCNQME